MLLQAEATALIRPEQTWILWSVILVGVALSIFLEQKYQWAARLSGPVIGLLLAMTLSSVGIMPTEAAVYGVVTDYLIPVAIPLLLFRANVLRIVRLTGKMFIAFHLSVIGTMVGAVCAMLIFADRLEHAAEIGGIMTASYSGGGVNFAAVSESFRGTVPKNVTNPLIVADNFIMAGMFLVLLVLAGSRFLLRHFPHPSIGQADLTSSRAAAAEHWARKPVGVRDTAIALAVAFVIATFAVSIAKELETHYTKHEQQFLATLLGNHYVWITALSLLVATLFHKPLDDIHGAEDLGGYILYIYLFTIGLPANLVVVLTKLPETFLFCGVMAVVNLAVTLGLGKLLRQNLEDLLVSVNATLGGVPSAVAMTISKGWPKLVLPAMLVGIWGYVIGTPLGIATARALQRMFE